MKYLSFVFLFLRIRISSHPQLPFLDPFKYFSPRKHWLIHMGFCFKILKNAYYSPFCLHDLQNSFQWGLFNHPDSNRRAYKPWSSSLWRFLPTSSSNLFSRIRLPSAASLELESMFHWMQYKGQIIFAKFSPQIFVRQQKSVLTLCWKIHIKFLI